MRGVRRTGMAGAVLAPVAALLLLVGDVAAQASAELAPSYGDGRLTIIGSSFRPGERVRPSPSR